MRIQSIDDRGRQLAKGATAAGRKTLINSISGGVDSTLSAMISKSAEHFSDGEVQVIALNLPCSADPARDADKTDAAKVAELLHIPMVTVELTYIWDAMAALLTGVARQMTEKSGIQPTEAEMAWAVNNLKPTLRMMAGGFFADAFKGLTVGTDNVVENFLGYFSIRGDGIADKQPIRDMLKGEVQSEVHCELMGQGSISGMAAHALSYRTPTPGLFDFTNHTDESELGFNYTDADSFVKWILEAEAGLADYHDNLEYAFMDRAMTVVPDWRSAIDYYTGPCPVSWDVADKIVAQNQKTHFKRKRTDLEDTLKARGLLED